MGMDEEPKRRRPHRVICVACGFVGIAARVETLDVITDEHIRDSPELHRRIAAQRRDDDTATATT